MNCSKNAVPETIFTDDFELEKLCDSIVKGWCCAVPAGATVTRSDFTDWLNYFIGMLNSSADDYFKRVEIIKHNLEVLKNESMS